MKAVLTSSLGGSRIENGFRVPDRLIERNGLGERLKSIWPGKARVLILCADLMDHGKNDSLQNCLGEALSMSGLSLSAIEICDDRNPEAAEDLAQWDVLILSGGHVPTQNRFFRELRLRERLAEFSGILLAMSAGSMNCAEMVYAGPELEGEAIDPNFQRWLPGLGITKVNIFPHFQSLREEKLDGLRLVEDITFDDSVGHPLLALNDGSYVFIDGGKTMVYGAAYEILDRKITEFCREGEARGLSV